MAATGRMSTYHERHPVSAGSGSGRTPPAEYGWPSEQEMEHISVQPKNGKLPSPGLAQGRWSHSHEPDPEDRVPLSASIRDDVGPAPGQAKDPFLHEQYFGVASSGVPGEELPGPSGYHPDQRASWGR